MTIEFTIPGVPQGKERPRFTQNGATYTPKKTKDYEKLVAWAYQCEAHGAKFTGAIRVDIAAIYPVPHSWSKRKQAEMMPLSQMPQSASGTAPAHAWRFVSPERRHPVTQCERILRHLQDYGSITQAEAVTEYGCYRLGARIWDLKAQGVPIKSETVTGKNRYGERTCFARYSIVKGE